jgi:predicted homoserine dehydrogenase-like protein
VRQGQSLCWADVAIDTGTRAYQLRREMESHFCASAVVVA